VYFALPKDLFFSVCDRADNSCFSTRRTSIFGKSLDSEFAFYTSSKKLSLTDTTGKTYLEITNTGEITKKENLDFELIP
jgi:hypothetical protein